MLEGKTFAPDTGNPEVNLPGLFHVGEVGCVVNMPHGIEIPEAYILFNSKPPAFAHFHSALFSECHLTAIT